MNSTKKVIILLLATSLSFGVVSAQTPVKVNKQGRLIVKDVNPGQVIINSEFVNPQGQTKKRAEWKEQSALSISAGQITAGAIASSEIADGTVSAADLANDAKPAGADFSGGNNSIALNSTDTVIRSVTISAPSSGIIVANSASYVSYQSGNAVSRCSITTDDGLDTSFIIIDEGGGVDDDDNFGGISNLRAFTVASAGDTTINLVCDASVGTATLLDSNLVAVFYPQQY